MQDTKSLDTLRARLEALESRARQTEGNEWSPGLNLAGAVISALANCVDGRSDRQASGEEVWNFVHQRHNEPEFDIARVRYMLALLVAESLVEEHRAVPNKYNLFATRPTYSLPEWIADVMRALLEAED